MDEGGLTDCMTNDPHLTIPFEEDETLIPTLFSVM